MMHTIRLFTTMLLIAVSYHLGFSQSTGETINLGLYGGKSVDLTYCVTNNRLFAAVETPASLFYSDDSCKSWTQPFPVDSLEYNSEQQGWGGGANKVLSNQNGWVAVKTSQQGGTLTAAVISYSEGDSGTFKTAIDGYILNQITTVAGNGSVNAIGLSDHYLYVGMGKYLIRLNDTSTYGPHNIVAETDTIPGIGSAYNICDIAVTNNSTGYPVYLVLNLAEYGSVYKFDGNSFTLISNTPAGKGVEYIFTHPAQNTGDTLFISVKDSTSGTRSVYRSLNGGASSFTDITPSSGTNWPLQNADYSSDWVTSMPSSNGLRLSFPGGGTSDDMGNTWTAHVLPDNAMASHPEGPDFVTGSYGIGVATSSSGPEGTFTVADNEGLAAVKISKIAQSMEVYYVSTNAGLGYTTAYFDSTVSGINQWQTPHGDFPIDNVGDDGGVSSVAIDPTDSLHVIAGYGNGFEVSFTGPAGFSNVTPAGWNSGTRYDALVTDIKFVNSDTVIAVTGSGSNALQFPALIYGNIWRSTNGGNSWTAVTPSGFEQGTCLVVGTANNDTVIYAGSGYYDANYSKVDGELWKSTDYGTTWSLINTGPTGLGSATTNMPIYDIDIDPRSNDTIYLASGENLDYALVQSTDGGVTYNYFSSLSPHGSFSSVLVNDTLPEIVSTGARRDLFRVNTITGNSMITFTGLPGEFIPDLENGSTLLGTTTGLYKLVENAGSVTSTWNGTGYWDESANWSDGVPNYLDNAVVSSGTLYIDEDVEVNKLTIGSDANVNISNEISVIIYR